MRFRGPALFLALMQVNVLALADWQEIDAAYKDETTYVDPSRIVREGDTVYFWELSSYRTPREVTGKVALSELSRHVVDCKKQVHALAYLAWYPNQNGTGEQLNFMTIPGPELAFNPIVPNSIGDKAAKLACSTSK